MTVEAYQAIAQRLFNEGINSDSFDIAKAKTHLQVIAIEALLDHFPHCWSEELIIDAIATISDFDLVETLSKRRNLTGIAIMDALIKIILIDDEGSDIVEGINQAVTRSREDQVDGMIDEFSGDAA